MKQPQEECEDGNQAAGDGCAPNCVVETGYTCSTFGCFPLCGDGLLRDTESCDDGNGISGDGCSAQCEAEHGFVCTGSEPASCHADCGDGLVASTEACDDGNLAGGDGCSELCTPEPGYFCDLTGDPAVCSIRCGDGVKAPAEGCDDGNQLSGDGCDTACALESGFSCDGPDCWPVCGDGFVLAFEACDDGNIDDGDGCDSDCHVEFRWDCETAESGSVCTTLCGNGVLDPGRRATRPRIRSSSATTAAFFCPDAGTGRSMRARHATTGMMRRGMAAAPLANLKTGSLVFRLRRRFYEKKRRSPLLMRPAHSCIGRRLRHTWNGWMHRISGGSAICFTGPLAKRFRLRTLRPAIWGPWSSHVTRATTVLGNGNCGGCKANDGAMLRQHFD